MLRTQKSEEEKIIKRLKSNQITRAMINTPLQGASTFNATTQDLKPAAITTSCTRSFVNFWLAEKLVFPRFVQNL